MNLPDWKYNYLIRQLQRTFYKAHENFLINSLFHDDRLINLKPLTQYYVKTKDNNYYFIDLFYPQINLAIEIDEAPHEVKGEIDLLRQSEIENILRCEFCRIRISANKIAEQIIEIKEIILKLIKESENNNTWKKWIEPKLISLSILKQDYNNTLFVKISGEIHPDRLLERQTGWWKIANHKVSHIRQAIIIHDGIVERVFTNLKFKNSADGKWGFDGDEIVNHILLDSIILDWKFQQTKQYSKVLYSD
ncbi:AbaSI family restriction endonuclease [Emticicia sp. BO119]|uniref:AbaSI family restriction endonuclease n=1 Tax=Emticicia sp. BO119 TaxID=2757768 RepID=UPI0015EFF2EF|nr:hypothetical protein [Emticicia sp. BO119]MBA4853807.1 hypothetical protein [Emticicia sp. BO119]